MSSAETAQPTQPAQPAQAENIIIPPHQGDAKPQPVVIAIEEEEEPQPCCALTATLGCFGAVLAFFIIFITIAGVLGQGQETFCNGYWRADPRYQFSKHSVVAVWALLQGCSFFLLGLLLVLEYFAASLKKVALRDQLRTVILWTACFFVAWAIAGNVWIIGDVDTGFGVVPTACKDGNMGNRNLYHFCLAIIIFLDITIPLGLLALLVLSRDNGVFCNKTIMGKNNEASTAASSRDGSLDACCTTSISGACCAFGLIFFLIFVTVAGVLGQSETAFCNGYWKLNPAYQLSKHSTVAVWALLQGCGLLGLGFLWFLENRAAVARATALRDRLRTLTLLLALANVGWLICGNIWIIGSTGAWGVIPQDCKDGNMGNRNLYHFCLAMIIFFDITFPLAMFGSCLATLNSQGGHIGNTTLGGPASSEPAPGADTKYARVIAAPCCSLPVSVFALVLCIALAATFIAVPSALEPGTMAHAWDQSFCQGYWRDPVAYPGAMMANHSTIAVWSLLMGACFFFIGVLWLLENRAAAMNAKGLRDQLRTLILLTGLFLVAWMIAGNVWIIGDTFNFGVVPNDCKDGKMGNRNLYHFVLAMIIFLDIMVPLALLAVCLRTGLGRTLACCDDKPVDAPAPQQPQPQPVVERPPSPNTILIGQA